MDATVLALGSVAVIQLIVLAGVLYLWHAERARLLDGFAAEREKLIRAALVRDQSPAHAIFAPRRDDDREREPVRHPIGLS